MGLREEISKMINRLRDVFTYFPSGFGESGKRKLRSFTIVLLAILVALGILIGVSLYQKVQAKNSMAVVGIVTLQPTQESAATPTMVSESCPSNPSDWTMMDLLPGDVYKRIEPTCVYEGLGKAVAWALAIQEGYSRQEAASLLGYQVLPMAQLSQVTVATNGQGPMPMDVYFVAPHPDLQEWYVNDAGEPAVSFVLQGCFRTFTIVGNQKQEWGNGYPVVCSLAMDTEATNMLMCLNAQCYTSMYSPKRVFALFGYSGNGDWIWLGIAKAYSLEINSDTVPDGERLAVVFAQALTVWDSSWLTQTYQMLSLPVPDGWMGFTDDSDLHFIASSINSYIVTGVAP
jgi:hypothetical protein